MKKKPPCCITNITNCSTDNMSSIYYDGAWTTGGFKVNTHILDLVEITSKAVPTDYMLSLVVPLAHKAEEDCFDPFHMRKPRPAQPATLRRKVISFAASSWLTWEHSI